MKKLNSILLFFVILSLGCDTKPSENKTDDFPVLTGNYFGLKEPGLKPEIFAANIVSTGMLEINACFSPDYKEFFYSIMRPNGQYIIISMTNTNDQWSAPEVASFSGEYPDVDPFISLDGKWLYFASKRPIDTSHIQKADWDIWRVERINGMWANPERLGSDINSETDEVYPCLSKKGALYFSSGRFGTNNRDIFYAKNTDKGFQPPIKMNDAINSHWEGDIYISPEEDYMIFVSFGRKEGGGLFITFNNAGIWSIPQRMNPEINTTGREFCPMVSPDGKYFFFASNRRSAKDTIDQKLNFQKVKEEFKDSNLYPGMGKNDVYWVDIKVIDSYRN